MDRERKAFEAFARGLVPEGVTVRQVTWDGAGIPRLCFVWPDGDKREWSLQKEWVAWRARAALSRAPGEATEAMVDAGARAIAGAMSRAMNLHDARELARRCWGAMRAESEGGGAVSGTGDRMEREACAGDSASAGPGPIGAAPPSPGSDLLREVEAFLREIWRSPAMHDLKASATARELADDLRALIEGCPHA